MRAALVVPAAGSGSRFGGEVPKQLLPLAGRPVLLRAIDPFLGLVERIVISTSADLEPEVRRLLAGESWADLVQVVRGGATRLHSVLAAVEAVPETCEAVLIHDAARPLVPRRCIESCLAALDGGADAAVVALPCPDTVKRVDPATGRVLATEDRSVLHLAQTPQGLRRAGGLAALRRAVVENWPLTDDVAAVERAGGRVVAVPGDPRNRKITTPADLALAEALLEVEGR